MAETKLEDVKVGDRVLVHYNNDCHTERVTRVGIATFRTDALRSYYIRTGCHDNGGMRAEHYYTVRRIATETDITAEAERQRAREERRERLQELRRYLPLFDCASSDETVTFELDGHCYEIREID